MPFSHTSVWKLVLITVLTKNVPRPPWSKIERKAGLDVDRLT